MLTTEIMADHIEQSIGEPVDDKICTSIAVVDDSLDLVSVLARRLQTICSDVVIYTDGRESLDGIRAATPNLVILDVGLPSMSGLDVCRSLRSEGINVPVILLSGRGDELDRIVGLEAGADDYLTKPFGPLELIARIRAVLRRARHTGVTPASNEVPPQFGRRVISSGTLVIDPFSREVRKSGKVLELTEKEFDLIYLLAANPGRVYSRAHLLDIVWGQAKDVFEDTVTSHVSRLRAKIEDDPKRPNLIQTVWGIGYRFGSGRAN